MDYRTFELTDAAVSSWWQVRPLASYGEQAMLQRSALYTLGGELRVWELPGTGRMYSLPLRFVDSAFQALAFSWWVARTPLTLVLNRATSAFTAFGVLANQAEPFAAGEEGRPDLWRGSLQLAATGSGASPGLFFLCGDSSLGLLGQSYNPVHP